MGRRGSNGSKSNYIRPLSTKQMRRILGPPGRTSTRGDLGVPKPESLTDFYNGLKEGDDKRLPFTLEQLGVAVDRALSVDKEKAELWKNSREDYQSAIIQSIGSDAVARACYLDLELIEPGARKINFGDGDNWFLPARRALAGATLLRLNETEPYRQYCERMRQLAPENPRLVIPDSIWELTI